MALESPVSIPIQGLPGSPFEGLLPVDVEVMSSLNEVHNIILIDCLLTWEVQSIRKLGCVTCTVRYGYVLYSDGIVLFRGMDV